MVDERDRGEIIEPTPSQQPEMRDLTMGEAVNVMVLNSLGLRHQALNLALSFVHQMPADQCIAPRVAPAQLNDDACGRVLDTRYAYGVTERYNHLAATAAEPLGLAPRVVHLDPTRVRVAGRDHNDADPEAQGAHITRGDRRNHRPGFNPVRLKLMVEPQARLSLLLHPRSGHRGSFGKSGCRS
jgi:hypothetical protein